MQELHDIRVILPCQITLLHLMQKCEHIMKVDRQTNNPTRHITG